MTKTFLKAEWRKLVMANYAIDPGVLAEYLPDKTEIDFSNGVCYVSLVGFMFKETAIKGFKIPFHINFEEVNLRFYVRHNDNGTWKRGVVFIKEIVPRYALTFVANTFYGEKYETLPMSHVWANVGDKLTVEYKWKRKKWNALSIITEKDPMTIQPESVEEFITEHYWGYTSRGKNKTSEYGVEHPRWNVYKTLGYTINVDFGDIYGPNFAFLGERKPDSVLLAEGSEVNVMQGRRL